MTKEKDYMNEFLSRFDPLISYMMIPAAILSYALTVWEYIKKGITSLTFINVLVGTVFLSIFIFKKYIKTDMKLKIIVTLVLFTGFDVLCGGSLKGNGRSLFMFSCIVSIIFLSRNFSIIVVTFTSLSLYIISGLVFISVIKSSNNGIDWLAEAFTYMIYIIIIYLAISSLKKHLASSINKLEQNSEEMKEIMLELESKYEEIKNNEEVINKLAYYDQLTMLPNQNMMKKYIDNRVKQGRSEGKFVIIDIKNFRIFNSIYSNTIGDQVLEIIGQLMRENDNLNMFSARITGNEYAMWFEDTSEEEIVKAIKNLNNKFFERYSEFIKYKKINFYASYSVYPEHGKDYVDLYQKAAIALTNARRFPEKEIVVFDEKLYEEIIKRETLKTLVEQTIQRNEFIIYYQKKVDTLTCEVYGVEALSRWITTEQGNIPPNVFIPIIEKSDLTIAFGENTVKNVLKDYTKLLEKYGEKLKVSINISPIHLISEGFSEFIINEIKSKAVNPENIILEITEEVMIEGVELVNSILQPLKDFGVKISLDDFGSGYSSLNYLSKLAPDELKIDRTFIEQLGDKKVVSLIESIIQLKNVYGFSVVAEGVETEQQLQILNEIGCNIIQGFYFSKPEPLLLV